MPTLEPTPITELVSAMPREEEPVPAAIQPTSKNFRGVQDRNDLKPGDRVVLWLPDSGAWSEPYTFGGWEDGKIMILILGAFPEHRTFKRRFSYSRRMGILA